MKDAERRHEVAKWHGDEAFAYTVSLGLVFRRASLGIDENGEQPGSYLQTKYMVPFTVTARL